LKNTKLGITQFYPKKAPAPILKKWPPYEEYPECEEGYICPYTRDCSYLKWKAQIPLEDYSGCGNCPFLCPNLESEICFRDADSYPGLKSDIEMRNEEHPCFSKCYGEEYDFCRKKADFVDKLIEELESSADTSDVIVGLEEDGTWVKLGGDEHLHFYGHDSPKCEYEFCRPKLKQENGYNKKYNYGIYKVFARIGDKDGLHERGISLNLVIKYAYIYKQISLQGRSSKVSFNKRGQSLNSTYFDEKRHRFYLSRGCYFCGGAVRYDKHLNLICDGCSTVQDNNIFLDEYLNLPQKDEEDNENNEEHWHVDAYQAGSDYSYGRVEPGETGDGGSNRHQVMVWGMAAGAIQAGATWNSAARQKIRNDTPRNIQRNDISLRRIGIICSELGHKAEQVKNSTILQKKFGYFYNKRYGEVLSRQGIRAKINQFIKYKSSR
jgi:hypothetical protein